MTMRHDYHETPRQCQVRQGMTDALISRALADYLSGRLSYVEAMRDLRTAGACEPEIVEMLK